MKMDKMVIIRNFSRYARTYDNYADIQKRSAFDLLQFMKGKDVKKILEIGCGTGNYTLLLRERFKDAKLKALDISGRMLEVASGKIKDKGINFMEADAETLVLEEKFDLITSNACMQWFLDLESGVAKYKNMLREKGVILFSIFGPDTLCELNASLKEVFGGVSITSGNFAGEERLKDIIKNNFGKVKIKEAAYEESFPRVRDLLNKIKHTGTNGNGLGSRVVFTPGIIKKLEEIYLDKFGKIRTTYQVFFCLGEK